jgi:lysophospholipase L1-like esterase
VQGEYPLFRWRNRRADAKKKADAVIGGDSNTSTETSWASRLELDAVNGGFWNTCMAQTGDAEGYFCAANLVDAMIANNFDEFVKSAINDDFKKTALALNATDMRTAKLIGFAYGANDFNKNVPIETFAETIRGIISKLRANLPNAKLLFVTPGWRVDKPESIATFKNAIGLRLEDYVNAIVDVCGRLGVIVVDFYHNGGINDSNADGYFWSDGLHFSNAAHEKLAAMVKAAIAAM